VGNRNDESEQDQECAQSRNIHFFNLYYVLTNGVTGRESRLRQPSLKDILSEVEQGTANFIKIWMSVNVWLEAIKECIEEMRLYLNPATWKFRLELAKMGGDSVYLSPLCSSGSLLSLHMNPIDFSEDRIPVSTCPACAAATTSSSTPRHST